MRGLNLILTRRYQLARLPLVLIRQSLFANAGYLFAVQFFNSLVGFLFWTLAARRYSAVAVGNASAVIAAVALVANIAGMGLGLGLVRFLPASVRPHLMLDTIFTLTTASAAAVAALFLLGLPIWSPALMFLRDNQLFMSGFITYAVASALVTIMEAAFLARRKAHYSLFNAAVINTVRLTLLLLLVQWEMAGIVGSVVAGTAAAAAASFLLFYPRVDPGYHLRLRLNRSLLRRLLPYSLGNHFSGLLTQLPQRLLPLIVLALAGPAATGYAQVAWMIGALLVSPGLALAGSAFAEGANAPDQASVVLLNAGAGGLLLTIPLALILLIVAPWLLLLFGAEYSHAAASMLRWLAVAAPLVVLTWLYFTLLRLQKRVARLVILGGLMAVVLLATSALFLPHLGITATSLGWMAAHSLIVALATVDLARAGLLHITISDLRQKLADRSPH